MMSQAQYFEVGDLLIRASNAGMYVVLAVHEDGDVCMLDITKQQVYWRHEPTYGEGSAFSLVSKAQK